MILNPFLFGDSDASALIARMSPAPSGAIQTAINNAITSLKAGGYWTRFDSLYVPKKAAVQQNGLLDWRRNVSATLHGSASWDATYGLNGSIAAGSYFDPQFVPSVDGVNLTANNGGYGCYITAASTAGALFGGYGPLPASKNRTMAYFINSPNVNSFSNCAIGGDGGGADTINNTAANTAVAGVMQLNRTNDSLQTLYMDGVSIGSSAYAIADRTLSTQKVFILAECDYTGVSAGNCAGKIGAWWAGDDFDTTDQLAIKAIFDTYFAAIS